MHYLSVEELTKSFGVKPLFAKISFHMEEGDKIALVARNGSGKSTLLRILAGKEIPDSGKVWIHKDLTVALFEQEPLFIENQSILDNIFFHDHPIIKAIKNFEACSEAGDSDRLTEAIVQMDELRAWDFDSKVKQILGKLNIHQLHLPVNTLSGGQRKRVALAKTLIDIGFDHKHVLLIMDEPTNHLDLDMVEWLEHFLNQAKLTLLLVTHDRYFLDSVCDEIWELDQGSLWVYKGDYENFLEKKTARFEMDAAGIEKARNTYRKELEWMRKQPKARTTKSKSRQDRFQMVEARAKRNLEEDPLELQHQMTRLGGKIAEFKRVYKKYDDNIILKGFDYGFKKGERLGIIGRNGSGKTTLIHLLQGTQLPDSGKIIIGETVVFGHYSQDGLQIKEDVRLIEFVKNIADQFPLADGGFLSASQFLNLFLFPNEQQYTYISSLSGGEKRRLHLLTVLFKNPNFLILDEPTNDLDLPTLGVLENFLCEFQGCLVIVSHDRYFMDRLVDHLLLMEGNGVIRDFPGNYTQYREWKKKEEQSAIAPDLIPLPALLPGKSEIHSNPEKTDYSDTLREKWSGPVTRKKLSYKEKREFETLEMEIETLEKERTSLNQKLYEPGTAFEVLDQASRRIGQINALLNEKELRWLELSEAEN
jgi:ABC transport system ATP-binding/permease protein